MIKYNMNNRKFLKLLNKLGFNRVRQNGSHAVFRRENFRRVFTIEKNSHTYSQGHLKKLLKDFDLTISDLHLLL